MKAQLFYGSAFLLIAAPALADPCVSATFDLPFPDATGVQSFIVDVPSARFPAFWQMGFIDGYQYRLFSNGEGEITASDPENGWTVEITCETSGQSCDVTAIGAAPAEVLQIADALGQCLLGIEIAQAQTIPEDPIADTPFTPPADVVAPRNTETEIACGVATINEANDVATMQRLLILLGEDPGPVDGFLGPATFKAMDVFVEDSNWETSIIDVISVLDALHCERSQ